MIGRQWRSVEPWAADDPLGVARGLMCALAICAAVACVLVGVWMAVT